MNFQKFSKRSLGEREYLQFVLSQGEALCIQDKLVTYGAGAEREGWPKWCAAEKQQQPKLKQRGEEEGKGSRGEKRGAAE